MRCQLHIFPTFALGGAQRRFIQLANEMHDWRHVIVSLDGDTTAFRSINENVVFTLNEIETQKSPIISVSNLKQFRSLFENVQPDLLCTYNWGSVEAALANRMGGGIPHIHFEDGFGPDEMSATKKRRNFFRRIALGGNSHIVVPSRQLSKLAKHKWGIQDSRLHYMLNGVDTEIFTPIENRSMGKTVVGSIGALRPEKNYARLVSALSHVKHIDEVVLYGDGPERENLEQQAKDIKCSIDFRGGTNMPQKAYHQFDIFVLSSDTEQMPLTILEAMASGLPIVSTDVGDVRYMVSEENLPFILPKGDVTAMSHAITKLAGDKSLRNGIGSANRRHAVQRFNQANMIRRYEHLFDTVASATKI